jgi:hypothetical protein
MAKDIEIKFTIDTISDAKLPELEPVEADASPRYRDAKN